MEIKLEVTVADHIQRKDMLHHMLGVERVVLAQEELPLVMELALQTIPKTVNMEFLLLIEV